jgi:chromosome segregation ATPase
MTKPDREAAQKALLTKVDKAYRELETAGKRPTVDAIRQITGGSYTALCPAVRTVKERRDAERQHARAIPEIPAEVKEVFDAAWRHAYQVADANGAAAQQSFAAALESKDTEIAEREGVIAELETEVETLKREIGDSRRSHHESELEAREERRQREDAEAACSLLRATLEERQSILSRFLPHPDTATEGSATGTPDTPDQHRTR